MPAVNIAPTSATSLQLLWQLATDSSLQRSLIPKIPNSEPGKKHKDTKHAQNSA